MCPSCAAVTLEVLWSRLATAASGFPFRPTTLFSRCSSYWSQGMDSSGHSQAQAGTIKRADTKCEKNKKNIQVIIRWEISEAMGISNANMQTFTDYFFFLLLCVRTFCLHLKKKGGQTCDSALSNLQDSVADGSPRQQVDVIRRAQHDVLQNQQPHLSSTHILW